MIRSNGRVPGSFDDERLQRGIRKLQSGRRAPEWVCCEVIGVGRNATQGQIIEAIHEAIHLVMGDDEVDRYLSLISTKVCAGAIILAKRLRTKG